MNSVEDKQQWQRWVEAEIGGPEALVQAATQAALDALAEGKNRDEVVAVAQEAAASWKDERPPRPGDSFEVALLPSSNALKWADGETHHLLFWFGIFV
jgi:hypothetical protein